MKLKKITASVIIGIMALLLGIRPVSAASASLSLTSNDNLVAGGKATVTLSLASIDGIDNGVSAMQGKFEYDPDVIEKVTMVGVPNDDEDAEGFWSASFAKATGMFTLYHTAGDTFKNPHSLITITLKFKENITVNETTITVKDAMVSDGNGDTSTEDVSLTLRAAAPEPSDPTPTPTATPTPTPTPTPTITPTPTATPEQLNPKSTDTSTAGNKIPQTGVDNTVVIIMAVVAVIGIGSLVRYSIYKKDIK